MAGRGLTYEQRRAELAARSTMDSGTYSTKGDVLSFQYHDTERIVTGSVATLRYFLNGTTRPFQLVPAVVKTVGDANFLTAGVPANQKWIIRSLGIIYRPAAVFTQATYLALINYLCNAVLTIRIDGKDKVYERKLAGMLGLRFNALITPAVAGDTSTPNYNNIIGHVSLGKAITLSANTEWSIELAQYVAVPAAQNNDDISIELPVTLGRRS